MVKAAKLKKRFKEVPGKVEAALRPVMEDFAKQIVAQMKYTAPKDSGALRDSIGWTWGAGPKGAMTVGEVRHKGVGLHITIYVGTRDKTLGDRDAYYARWVEFGTSGHVNGGMFAGSENPGITAQPFFYPVWRANRRRVKAGVNRALRKALK